MTAASLRGCSTPRWRNTYPPLSPVTEITFIYLCRLCLRNIAILRFSPQDAVFHSGLFLVSMVHAAIQPRSMFLLIIFFLTQTRCSCINIRIGNNFCCFAEVLHILSIISIWIFFTQDVPCSIDICIDGITLSANKRTPRLYSLI